MKIEDGKIVIDIEDAINNLDGDSELLEALSCNEYVISHVMDQVLDGMTKNGWRGSHYGGNGLQLSELQKASREIAKRSSETAKEEIQKLEQKLKGAVKSNAELHDYISDLEDGRYLRGDFPRYSDWLMKRKMCK